MPSLRLSLNITTALNSVLYGSIYSVVGFEPSLVFDFIEEYYRTNNTDKLFQQAMTTTRAGNATMTDSDGLLKWAPHSYVSQSEDFNNAVWAKGGATVTSDAIADPDGATTADKLIESSLNETHYFSQVNAFTLAGVKHTASIWVQPAERTKCVLAFGGASHGGAVNFDLSLGTIGSEFVNGSGVIHNKSIVPVGDYYKISIEFSVTTIPTGARVSFSMTIADVLAGDPNSGLGAYQGDGVSGLYVWGGHTYRSDLGGMVNNPDRGDSYVPTTDAAVYLPRVGHHIWDGSAWVNKGVLHEGEARTNLIADSLGLSALVASGTGTVTLSATVAPLGAGAVVKRVQGVAVNDGASIQFSVGAAGNYVSYIYARSRTGSAQDVKVTNSGSVGPSTTLPADGSWIMVFGSPSALGAGTRDMRILQVSGNIDIDVSLPESDFGSTPLSYIPTAGATATRAADIRTTPSANLPYSATAMSGSQAALLTYADTDSATEQTLFDWRVDANNRITVTLDTAGANTGKVTITVVNAGVSVFVTSTNQVASGINVLANVAWRVTTSEINIALNGTAATAVSNTAGIPDVSGADAAFYTNGIESLDSMWSDDLGDVGIAEASA